MCLHNTELDDPCKEYIFVMATIASELSIETGMEKSEKKRDCWGIVSTLWHNMMADYANRGTGLVEYCVEQVGYRRQCL